MATTKKPAAKTKPKPTKGSPAGATADTVSKIVSSKELAAVVGVELTKRLDPTTIRRLRKALPGYVSMLDDVAGLLHDDAALLNLPDVTPEALLTAQGRQKYLAAREGVVETVHRSIYEQRLQADHEAMGMLLKIARRIDAVAEDDPDVRIRWKSLLDFLSKFRRGAESAAPGAGDEEDK
jgi:hypothetical protein